MLARLVVIVVIAVPFLCLKSFAEEVVVAFGENRPPFIIGIGKRGLEVDIVREALKQSGHSLKVVQMPNARLKATANIALQWGRTDAVAGVREGGKVMYMSDSYVTFHNYAITKAAAGIQINTIADLKGKTVVAWQNARNDLGDAYRQLVDSAVPGVALLNYYEHPNQREQVEMFWKGRADVLIIDKSVFVWQSRQLATVIDTEGAVSYHDVFPQETLFYVVFRQQRIRDDFNDGLRVMKENGRYQALVDSYLD